LEFGMVVFPEGCDFRNTFRPFGVPQNLATGSPLPALIRLHRIAGTAGRGRLAVIVPAAQCEQQNQKHEDSARCHEYHRPVVMAGCHACLQA
jgi:hypothetical protein